LKDDGVLEVCVRSISNTFQAPAADFTIAQNARSFLQLDRGWELINSDEGDEKAIATVDDEHRISNLSIYR